MRASNPLHDGYPSELKTVAELSTPVNFLALDLATVKTGWASSFGTSGTWKLKDTKDTYYTHLFRIWEKLDWVRNELGVDVVVAEAAHIQYASSAKPLYELRGSVIAWCMHRGVHFYGGFAPTTIKKHATGSGKADKLDMIVSAVDKFTDRLALSEHEADALWLLDLAQSLYAANGLDGLNDGGAQKPARKQPKPQRDSSKPGRKRKHSEEPVGGLRLVEVLATTAGGNDQ